MTILWRLAKGLHFCSLTVFLLPLNIEDWECGNTRPKPTLTDHFSERRLPWPLARMAEGILSWTRWRRGRSMMGESVGRTMMRVRRETVEDTIKVPGFGFLDRELWAGLEPLRRVSFLFISKMFQYFPQRRSPSLRSASKKSITHNMSYWFFGCAFTSRPLYGNHGWCTWGTRWKTLLRISDWEERRMHFLLY